jgi:hypothetical protein
MLGEILLKAVDYYFDAGLQKCRSIDIRTINKAAPGSLSGQKAFFSEAA